MFISEIRKEEDSWRVLDKNNRTLKKGTREECETYLIANGKCPKCFKSLANSYSGIKCNHCGYWDCF